MSDQASTTDKKFRANVIRKVGFAEVALNRLRGSLSGSRNWSRRDELSISISDHDQSAEEQLVGDACVDSESGTGTESEVGTKSRGRVDRASVPGIIISDDSGWPTERQSPQVEVKKSKAVTRAPEQAITLFAFRLAMLEKAAGCAGTLTFVWATVVLLGGFSTFLSTMDFWVVTCLLLTEGSRIFLLSNELEWQRASFRASLHQFGSTLARRSSNVVSGEDLFQCFGSSA